MKNLQNFGSSKKNTTKQRFFFRKIPSTSQPPGPSFGLMRNRFLKLPFRAKVGRRSPWMLLKPCCFKNSSTLASSESVRVKNFSRPQPAIFPKTRKEEAFRWLRLGDRNSHELAWFFWEWFLMGKKRIPTFQKSLADREVLPDQTVMIRSVIVIKPYLLIKGNVLGVITPNI